MVDISIIHGSLWKENRHGVGMEEGESKGEEGERKEEGRGRKRGRQRGRASGASILLGTVTQHAGHHGYYLTETRASKIPV